MYNGANGDTFCEVLVSRRRGTPETVKAASGYYSRISLLSGHYSAGTDVFHFCLFRYGHWLIFVVRMQKLEYEYIFTSRRSGY